MLHHAAKIMWECDCGWVPVVDDARRVVGVVTDRDICMACYTRGSAPELISVAGTMSTNVHACRPDDPLENALAMMRNYRVRRLPVVDPDGALLGLLSISDILRRRAETSLEPMAISRVLAEISEPRSAEPAA
jgi:CBS domain-containing protein